MMPQKILEVLTVVHVEDDPDWQEEVRTFVSQRIDKPAWIASPSTIAEMRTLLSSTKDPLVVLVDLRLGAESANYSGYHWLLEEAENFRRFRPRADIFIISGQLHEGIVETLRRRGIPDDHIYDKGSWAERRDVFLEIFSARAKELLENREEIDRNLVFICYSRRDEIWRRRLEEFLQPLVRQEVMSIWSDRCIDAGSDWHVEIRKALYATKVAVLLVTQHFLASEFISENELPPLLEGAAKEGVKILWIPVSASLYAETDIARYQSLSNPRRPLDTLTKAKRSEWLVDICRKIKETALKDL